MTDELLPGQVIADKYRVERILGEGGMGYVVAAYHLKLEQKVALKFLKPEALAHQHIVQRFAREARAAAKIQGEHVARVIDVGELPSGAPYIVMEYLDGEDLAHRLHQRGPLPVTEAVGYLLEACEALAEAHAAGIVHRDLKPPNLFLARSAGRIPIIKILDFGISKAVDEQGSTDRNLTSTSMIMGTPHYMSPEQLRSSRDVDARSDIWALGVVLFELLTGQPPFDGENTTSVITAIVTEPPRRLLDLRPDAPRELENVIGRCLAKLRIERYADILELARALSPFAVERAQASLPRIERIVRPMLSNAPPAPAVSGAEPLLGTTRVDPMPSAAGAPTVATADISGQRPLETHANWDATLPAGVTTPAAPGRGRALVAAAVLLALALAAGVALLVRPGEPLKAAAEPPSSSSVVSASPTPAVPAAAPAGAVAAETPTPAAAASVPSSPAPALSSAAPAITTAAAPSLAIARRKSQPKASPETAPAAPAVPKAPPASANQPASGSLRMGIK
jgi:serine/threonine protein kinase